jgi:hypothetical protein
MLSTIFTSLQGDEPGLVAYWPFDDGSGQFATDATGNGQDARLGSTDGVDDQDPVWVVSDSPIIPPNFQLTPFIAGLGTDIGISSFLPDVFNCGWSPGEVVEIWWDKPEAQLAIFTVDAMGCFEGMFRLDDVVLIPGSEPNTHEVQARGSVSGVVTSPIEQVVPQLHLTPSQGPAETELAISGCGWDGATTVTVLLQPNNDLLAIPFVDPFTGCLDDTFLMPSNNDGIYGMLATSDMGHASGAAYRVVSPPGKISGTKWHDLNGNGRRDAGEPGLDGVTIYIDKNTNEEFDAGDPSVLTDVEGRYAFTGLSPLTYLVGEVVPDGFARTFPALDFHSVNLEAGMDVQGLDFGNWVPPEDIVVELPPGRLLPGSILGATASGFKPGLLVKAFLQSDPVLVGEELADGEGNVSFQITIPLDFPPGDHMLILLGQNPDDSERRLTYPLTVESASVIFQDGFE